MPDVWRRRAARCSSRTGTDDGSGGDGGTPIAEAVAAASAVWITSDESGGPDITVKTENARRTRTLPPPCAHEAGSGAARKGTAVFLVVVTVVVEVAGF